MKADPFTQIRVFARKIESKHAFWCAEKFLHEIEEHWEGMPPQIANGLYLTIFRTSGVSLSTIDFLSESFKQAGRQETPFVEEEEVLGEPEFLSLNTVRQALAYKNQNWVLAMLGVLSGVNAPMSLQASTSKWASEVGYGVEIRELDPFNEVKPNLLEMMKQVANAPKP